MKGSAGADYSAQDFIDRLENDRYHIVDVAGPLKRFLGKNRTLYSLTIETDRNLRRVVNHIGANFPAFKVSSGGQIWSGEMNQNARLSFLDAIGLSGQTDAIGLSGQTDSTICEGETFFLSDNLANPHLFTGSSVTWTNASIPVISEVGSLSESGDAFEALFTQEHVTVTGADLVWSETTGEDVLVAVLDTGIDYNHAFLSDAVARDEYGAVQGRNFVERSDNGAEDPAEIPLNDTEDGVGYGHGTHVAGIIRSMAPDVSILPVRVADSTGRGSLFALLCGFDYALKQGADVINLSMSFNNDSVYLKKLMRAAAKADVLVVTSAGNANNGEMTFPANYPKALVAASVNADLNKSCYSNFGEEVDVAAYGEGVLSAHPGGGYAFRFGTSMSAPIVSGQVALFRELNPNAPGNRVHRRISRSGADLADPLFFDGLLGSGLTDVPRSLNLD